MPPKPCSMTSHQPLGICSSGMYGVGAFVGDGCGDGAAASATDPDRRPARPAAANAAQANNTAPTRHKYVFKSIPLTSSLLGCVLRPLDACAPALVWPKATRKVLGSD